MVEPRVAYLPCRAAASFYVRYHAKLLAVQHVRESSAITKTLPPIGLADQWVVGTDQMGFSPPRHQYELAIFLDFFNDPVFLDDVGIGVASTRRADTVRTGPRIFAVLGFFVNHPIANAVIHVQSTLRVADAILVVNNNIGYRSRAKKTGVSR